MEINKKAVFFSLTSLVVVSLLLVTVQADANRRSSEFVQVQIQDFQSDIEELHTKNLPEKLRVYTRNTLDQVAKENIQRLTNSQSTMSYSDKLSNCLVTEDNKPSSTCESEGIDFSKTIDDIQSALDKQQYNSSIVLKDIQVSQNGAWQLVIVGTFDVYVEKNTKDIRSTKEVVVTETMTIEGLIDPVSSVERGEIHVIRRIPRSEDIEYFYNHVREGSYVQLEQAPSYLERLTGQRSASSTENYGIGSLLPLSYTQREELYSVDFGNRDIATEDCRYVITVSEVNSGSQASYVTLSGQHIASYIEGGYLFNDLLTNSERAYSENCDADGTTLQ